ncbi:MAG: ASPIC/UnbV domain-containing protein, partial [Pirellulales bacterium]
GLGGGCGAGDSIYPANQAGQQPARLLGLREARGNNGYLGQDDPVLHFGLGEHEAVDLVVKFVDGSTTVRRNVSAGQTILVADPR